MLNQAMRAGSALLLGLALWALHPGASFAQQWSINLDLPVDSVFHTRLGGDHGSSSKVQDVKAMSTPGELLSVTLPYHVGFGLESYIQRLQPPGVGSSGVVLDFSVQMLDVYVDLPVTSWFTFSPGTGWGKGTFSVEGKTQGFQPPEDVNLWQFFAVAGFQLPWSLHLRLGYHEAHGDIINKSGTPNGGAQVHKSQPMQTSLTTLGLGYTF